MPDPSSMGVSTQRHPTHHPLRGACWRPAGASKCAGAPRAAVGACAAVRGNTTPRSSFDARAKVLSGPRRSLRQRSLAPTAVWETRPAAVTRTTPSVRLFACPCACAPFASACARWMPCAYGCFCGRCSARARVCVRVRVVPRAKATRNPALVGLSQFVGAPLRYLCALLLNFRQSVQDGCAS